MKAFILLYKDWPLIVVFSALFVGAFFWSTVGGIFLVAPFVHNILTGLLTGLVLSNYPERMNWLTFFNVLFGIGAFVTAAVGGIRIGLSLWGPAKMLPAIFDWGMIFLTVVVPLQLLGAVFEGLLFKRLYVEKRFLCRTGSARIRLAGAKCKAKNPLLGAGDSPPCLPHGGFCFEKEDQWYLYTALLT
ncbi:MAG TPA: hypothetical protein VIL83_06615 [Capillibacterium sp.]